MRENKKNHLGIHLFRRLILKASFVRMAAAERIKNSARKEQERVFLSGPSSEFNGQQIERMLKTGF
jgi:hypothetical protein